LPFSRLWNLLIPSIDQFPFAPFKPPVQRHQTKSECKTPKTRKGFELKGIMILRQLFPKQKRKPNEQDQFRKNEHDAGNFYSFIQDPQNNG
jgi:hypothetical protein